MKERTGLDCIGHLGDVLFEKTEGPTPQMPDWSRPAETAPRAPGEQEKVLELKPRRGRRLRLLAGLSAVE